MRDNQHLLRALSNASKVGESLFRLLDDTTWRRTNAAPGPLFPSEPQLAITVLALSAMRSPSWSQKRRNL
jgi:hypothetical protein